MTYDLCVHVAWNFHTDANLVTIFLRIYLEIEKLVLKSYPTECWKSTEFSLFLDHKEDYKTSFLVGGSLGGTRYFKSG